MAAWRGKGGAEALGFAALFAVAWAARWPVLGAAPYGDEAAHFTMARTLGFLGPPVHWINGDGPFALYPLVIGRPAFALLHAPGAAFGFEGFRVLGIAYACSIPVLLAGLLHQGGVRRGVAWAAGLVAALHPSFVVWQARIFPDGLMAALFLGGLWAWMAGRTRLALALFVVAAWSKESAIPAVLGLAALAAFEALRRLRAPSPDGKAGLQRPALAGAAAVVGAVPLVAAYAVVPILPGWVQGGELAPSLERMVLSSWLLVPVVAALWIPRARPVAVAALALLSFYLFFHVVRNGYLQSWYLVLPAALALAATAFVVDAGLKAADLRRPLAVAVALGVGFLMVAAVLGSGPGASKSLHPLHPASEAGLSSTWEFVRNEDAALAEAMAFKQARDPAEVLEVDPSWYWVSFPLGGSERTSFVRTEYEPWPVPVERVVAIGEASDLTWLEPRGTPFDRALHEVYQDCVLFSNKAIEALDLRACPGRLAQLQEAFERERALGGGPSAA